jgi:hypothetical protein
LAVLAGLTIFFTGGTASPIVVAIGGWIGGLAGLSGIAATNYGLALLGFGAMSAGGLGVAGGVAVLTAALTFSTEIVIDYTLTTAINTYSHQRFVKDSKKMITLPIPQNEDGSRAYENTVVYLKEHIDTEKPLFIDENQEALRKAMEKFEITTEDEEERIKDFVLSSYLFFAVNDYDMAKKKAGTAIELAREKKIRRTMPAFLYATSTLYEDSFDFRKITQDYFRYSVLAEPDNELIPLMFAIYLERVLYRMNDDESLGVDSLNMLRDIAFEIKDEEIRTQALVAVLMRYFMRVKIEQQKILALAESENDTIRDNPKTLSVVKEAFQNYQALLSAMSPVLEYGPLKEQMSENEEIGNLSVLYARYEESVLYLKKVIDELEEYQKNTSGHERVVGESGYMKYIWFMSGGLLFLAVFVFLIKRSRNKA